MKNGPPSTRAGRKIGGTLKKRPSTAGGRGTATSARSAGKNRPTVTTKGRSAPGGKNRPTVTARGRSAPGGKNHPTGNVGRRRSGPARSEKKIVCCPTPATASEQPLAEKGPVRLQKWLAAAGLCSRRQGEQWIAEGRVRINGEIITRPGTKVEPGDRVSVDGQSVQRLDEPRLVLALHKPPGVLCTRHDPEGRPTVFQLLGKDQPRLISVGRLDYNSEGLLLFTNDGQLANQLMHPRGEVERTYRVRVHGRIDTVTLEKLRLGVTLADGPTGPLKLDVDQVPGANSWLTITLREGRNRIVRRIFETLEMKVSRLIRTAYGGITLGDIDRGKWRVLNRSEVTGLLKTGTGGKEKTPR